MGYSLPDNLDWDRIFSGMTIVGAVLMVVAYISLVDWSRWISYTTETVLPFLLSIPTSLVDQGFSYFREAETMRLVGVTGWIIGVIGLLGNYYMNQ